MPIERRAARLIVLDGSNRLLLLQYARPSGETYWATPGGGLESDETYEMAAAREALEELGVVANELHHLWDGETTLLWEGKRIRQAERFFLLRVGAHRFSEEVRRAHRAEGILDARWWTVPELLGTAVTVFPEELAVRVATLTAPRDS